MHRTSPSAEGTPHSPEFPADEEYVLIGGVAPAAYARVLDALGEYHLRHTFDRGTLEMRRVLHAVRAESYRAFLEALPDHHVRHTYDGWTLEMMTPRKRHEWIVELIGRMLDAVALAQDIAIQSTGSTTLSRSSHDRGVQPDKSYYVGRENVVRGAETYRPGEDPPPDLVIEVDVTNSSIPRLPVYALIGVPEIWRHQHDTITFYQLTEQEEYEPIERSMAFPSIAPDDVNRFLVMRHKTDENSVVRGFVECIAKKRDQDN